MSQIEHDEVEPSIVNVRKLAAGLGVTLTEIVAEWEGIALEWIVPRKKVRATAHDFTGSADGIDKSAMPGGNLMWNVDAPNEFAGLIAAWAWVPAERRKEFVSECVQRAAELGGVRARASTGTGPNE